MADPTSGARKVIERHGWGFQFAVGRHLSELRASKRIPWLLRFAELPVFQNGKPTHVDLIASAPGDSGYLIAECKRADPSRENWLFARSGFTHRKEAYPRLLIERFSHDLPNRAVTRVSIETTEPYPFQIAVPLKTGAKGDGRVSDRNPILAAVTQVLRATSGFIQYLEQRPALAAGERPIFLLPVVFTTARLLVTETHMTSASVETGRFENDLAVQEVDWLWFNHNRTQDVGHDLEFKASAEGLELAAMEEVTRSVAIVASKGIEEFVSEPYHHWFT